LINRKMREVTGPFSDEAKDHNRYDQSPNYERGVLRILPPMFSLGTHGERPSAPNYTRCIANGLEAGQT
jgi:hypothetical protein